jgi:hypothetical protein
VSATVVRLEGHVLDLVIERVESVRGRNLVLGEVVHLEELRGEHEACRGRVRQPAGSQDVRGRRSERIEHQLDHHA